MKVRKNLTLGKKILEMAQDIRAADGYQDLTAVIEGLIRDEWKRRPIIQGATASAPDTAPAPACTSSESTSDTITRQILQPPPTTPPTQPNEKCGTQSAGDGRTP